MWDQFSRISHLNHIEHRYIYILLSIAHLSPSHDTIKRYLYSETICQIGRNVFAWVCNRSYLTYSVAWHLRGPRLIESVLILDRMLCAHSLSVERINRWQSLLVVGSSMWLYSKLLLKINLKKIYINVK